MKKQHQAVKVFYSNIIIMFTMPVIPLEYYVFKDVTLLDK